MLIYLFAFSLSKSNNIQHMLPPGIGYFTVNRTEGLSHIIFTPFFSNTIVSIVKKTPNAIVSLRHEDGTSPTSIIARRGSEIKVDFSEHLNTQEESVTFSYATLENINCQYAVILRDSESNIDLNLTKEESVCFLYSPKGKYLQYYVSEAKMDNRRDSLTIYQHSARSSWYDRYETITSPSGWSAISNTPWFIRFKGSENSYVSLKFKALVDKQEQYLISKTENAYESSFVQFSSQNGDIFFAVLGCFAPSFLIAGWIFAYCRLSRKDND